ncbi:MAG: alpha/beta hydrolase [Flavobacteriaceae bacterium]|jgi:acetyl esterase/lipase|nr:alpha/beta hydrolase [Flavobacteriaceae bacterium]
MNKQKLFYMFCMVFTIHCAIAQKFCLEGRYTNTDYFLKSQIDSLKNISYGAANDYMGNLQDLKMDVYFPNSDIDTQEKRPLILLIHGGGFTGGSRESMSYHSKELSKRGFVTATISYRLGYNREVFGNIQKAVYRAQQDANSALRYIASQKEKFKVDMSWVFIGGSSAGAITSLSTSYASQEEWNKIAPQFESDLGPLESSENSLNEIFTIKGIYNFMGAILPVVFNSGDLIPTISFHGELDTTVPIGKSMMTGFGSRPIHEMLIEAGVCNDLTVVPNGGHGIYRTKKDVDFRINRVSCFFKSLICNTCVDFMAEESVISNCTN